jgi:hypothetical protein
VYEGACEVARLRGVLDWRHAAFILTLLPMPLLFVWFGVL